MVTGDSHMQVIADELIDSNLSYPIFPTLPPVPHSSTILLTPCPPPSDGVSDAERVLLEVGA